MSDTAEKQAKDYLIAKQRHYKRLMWKTVLKGWMWSLIIFPALFFLLGILVKLFWIGFNLI